MDTTEALRCRIQSATPKDTVLGLFYEGSLTHISRTRGPLEAEALRSTVLGRTALDGFMKYPAVRLLEMVDRVSRQSGGGTYHHEHMKEMGRATVRSFLESPIGKTMAMLSAGDVHRLLANAGVAYGSATSFGKVSYERLGERKGRLTYEKDLLGPAWQQGALEEGLERVCGMKARVEVELRDVAASRFTATVEW